MAPEVGCPESATNGYCALRADMWSLGACLVEMLTLKLPGPQHQHHHLHNHKVQVGPGGGPAAVRLRPWRPPECISQVRACLCVLDYALLCTGPCAYMCRIMCCCALS